MLTAALYARFRSRQDHTFAEKVLSAMRFGFGGHVEAPPRQARRSDAACPTRSARKPMPIGPATAPTTVRPPDPCAMVIFGASGDLTKRLMVPALYNLSRTGLLPPDFVVIGIGREQAHGRGVARLAHDMLRRFVARRRRMATAPRSIRRPGKSLAAACSICQGDLTEPALYARAGQRPGAQSRRSHGTGGNVVFYLAVADQFFAPIVEHLGQVRPADEPKSPTASRRLLAPGGDREAVRPLHCNRLVSSTRTSCATCDEDQIFRIDHFLGKETVQNIMAFRFANGLFEPIWNRDRIDHVQITVAETVGVEQRGDFYEETGRAARHGAEPCLPALLSMVAMEPPIGFDAAAIRDKKAEVFAAMPAMKPDNAVRGQYGAGDDAGKPRGLSPGAATSRRDSPMSRPMSRCNSRSTIGAGPACHSISAPASTCPRRKTEIAIRFKQAPCAPVPSRRPVALPPNWLVLRIAPDEGISLQFEVKRPGPGAAAFAGTAGVPATRTGFRASPMSATRR